MKQFIKDYFFLIGNIKKYLNFVIMALSIFRAKEIIEESSKTMKTSIQHAKKQLESMIITFSEVRGIGIIREDKKEIIEIAIMNTQNIPAKLLEIIPDRSWKGHRVKFAVALEVIPFDRNLYSTLKKIS